MTAKTAATLFGLVFIAVGVLGFFKNPIVGDGAMFHTDTIHNCVHIASGVLFLLVAMAAPSSAGTVLKLFGIVYLLIGVVGIVQFGTSDAMHKEFGFLMVNGKDNILHVALGIVIFLAGFMKPRAAVA